MLKREMRSLRGLPSTQLNRICLAVSVAWGCMSVAGLLAVVTEGRLGRSWVGGAYQDMSNCRCMLMSAIDRERSRSIPNGSFARRKSAFRWAKPCPRSGHRWAPTLRPRCVQPAFYLGFSKTSDAREVRRHIDD